MKEVVSSNPGTVYWMAIFSKLFVVTIVMCAWKDENKMKKRPGLTHFKKKISNNHHVTVLKANYSATFPIYSLLMKLKVKLSARDSNSNDRSGTFYSYFSARLNKAIKICRQKA